MSEMTTTARKQPAFVAATVAALLTLLCSYWLFRWGLILLWQWQHEGRRIKFVFQQEIDAALLALLFGSSAFFVILRRSLHKKKT